jgi:hypothetical protein
VSADRADAIKAVDEAFTDNVKHLYAVFVLGLDDEEPSATLAERFKKGLAIACDAHGKTTAIIENYFRGYKP